MFGETGQFLRHQFAIRTLILHQPIRRTVFDDLTGFEHYDTIEVPQRRQTMRNRNDRAPAH